MIKFRLYDIEYESDGSVFGKNLMMLEIASNTMNYEDFIDMCSRYKLTIRLENGTFLFNEGNPVSGHWREDINDYIDHINNMNGALE